MKLRTILLSTVSILTPLAAQQAPQVRETPLKTYLTLTETQVMSLRQVQTDKRKAESAIYTQISEKQRQLDALLREGSNDAVSIGRLMVDINNLRRQLPLPTDQYRAAALAVLNDAQKSKLPALAQALTLAPAANEAAGYNLVSWPTVTPSPRPLPMPVIFSSASATVDVEPQ